MLIYDLFLSEPHKNIFLRLAKVSYKILGRFCRSCIISSKMMGDKCISKVKKEKNFSCSFSNKKGEIECGKL